MAILKIGTRVKIGVGADECFPAWAKGKRGVVVRRIMSDCGATRRDPMYVVRIGKRDAEVWTEELCCDHGVPLAYQCDDCNPCK